MTQLIFVRHGQTHGNVERRWNGWSDSSLTDLGKRQAELVANRLGELKGQIQALYSSPLSRAYQTAQPIARNLGLSMRLIEGLKEFHFGMIEGLTTPEVESRYPELLTKWREDNDPTFAYPEGESREAFLLRVSDALDLISARHPEETILVITHGGVLRATLSYYFPDEIDVWQRFTAGNGSLTVIQVNGHERKLVKLDDQEHLQELEPVIA